MLFNRLSRRDLMAGASAAAAAGLAGFPALAAADWKKFKGQKLEVSLVKGPRAENLQKYEKELTDLTGITVGSE